MQIGCNEEAVGAAASFLAAMACTSILTHQCHPGWGLVCSLACWAPPYPLMPKQVSLFGHSVPLEVPSRAIRCGKLPQ